MDVVLKRFLENDTPSPQDPGKDILAPVPEQEARLVGSQDEPEFAGDNAEATTRLTAADIAETGMFRLAVIIAFKTLTKCGRVRALRPQVL